MEESIAKCEECGEACAAHGEEEGVMCSCNKETCNCQHCSGKREA